jgi:hypothetical protein
VLARLVLARGDEDILYDFLLANPCLWRIIDLVESRREASSYSETLGGDV